MGDAPKVSEIVLITDYKGILVDPIFLGGTWSSRRGGARADGF